MPIIPCDDRFMEQAETLVRSVFRSMSPIERFSFLAIRRPESFAGRVLMFCAGVKDKVAFDVFVDESNIVLGTTGLYRYKKDHRVAAWVGWFCVDPEARGRGVGQALIEHTVARAQAAGFEFLRLYTSTDPNEAAAQRLYEKNGFLEVGRKRGVPFATIFREKRLRKSNET